MTDYLNVFNLSEIKYPQQASFKLSLQDAHMFECVEVVRCVPNKRLVCKGFWDGQAAYAKIFIGNQAQRYANRDLSGINALQKAAITTPALLQASEIVAINGQEIAQLNALQTLAFGIVLVFLAVESSENAEQIWQSTDANQHHHLDRLPLARLLVQTIAQHHNAGLIQHDLYLKNFLVAHFALPLGESVHQVYTLDGDGIRAMRLFMQQRQALHNLAVLLSKFEALEIINWLPELLTLYAKARGMQTAPVLKIMTKLIAHHRRAVVVHYADKKVFRQCTDIDVKTSSRLMTAISRNALGADSSFLSQGVDELINAKPSQVLKDGNTCTVSLVDIDGAAVVVKRYNIKSFWHGVSRALRPSRAAVSWSNAHRLIMYQIRTAQPIALIEERMSLIRKRAYFIAQYVEAPDIKAYFSDVQIDAAQKAQVAENMAFLFYKLRLLNIAHGDCKASNIKILNQQPVLIDLDSLHEYRLKYFFEQKHVRDLRRFLHNWQHDVATKVLLMTAFKKVYQDHRPLQKAWGSIKEMNSI